MRASAATAAFDAARAAAAGGALAPALLDALGRMQVFAETRQSNIVVCSCA